VSEEHSDSIQHGYSAHATLEIVSVLLAAAPCTPRFCKTTNTSPQTGNGVLSFDLRGFLVIADCLPQLIARTR
jgi:hypothetical protein